MTPEILSLIVGSVVALILLGFALAIIIKLLRKECDVCGLFCEPEKDGKKGKASMGRFQLLIFTFVIAGLYFLLSLEAGTFVDIPENVLYLLGISAGGFGGSKYIGRDPAPQAPKPIPNPEA